LFVCSKNKWRSPTAEKVFWKFDGLSTRSAGTSNSARRRVTIQDIEWADLILAMEDKHSSRLRAEFLDTLTSKDIHVLDIPDDYQYMDAGLIELLHEIVPPLISKFTDEKFNQF
jgi:predicted protein tyrosine phosphatase